MSAQETPIAPTLLVVEDDEDIAYLLSFMLARQGFRVITAADGRKAAALIDTEPRPALVILDIMLPYLDGFQLVQRIRERAEWAGVPVLMLTSKSQERDIVRALDAGASDYIVKPFQPGELLARVRRYLKEGA